MNTLIKKQKDIAIIILKIVFLGIAVIAQYILFSPILDPHCSSYPGETIISLFQKIILIYTTIIFVKFIDKKGIGFLGIKFEKGRSIKQFWSGCLAGIIFMAFIDIGAYAFHFVENGEFNFSGEIFFKGVLLQLFYTFVVALSEEILFRGYLLNNLRSQFSDFLSVVILSAIFAAPHIDFDTHIFEFLDVFLMGMILGYAYVITKSLYFSIGLHFVGDFIQIGVFRTIEVKTNPYLPIKFNISNDLIAGGFNLGTEIEMLFILAEAVLLIALLIYKKKKLTVNI